MPNIFDTENVSDLPRWLRKRLGEDHSYRKYLELLRTAYPMGLTPDESAVAMHRRYKSEGTPMGADMVLSNLCARGQAEYDEGRYFLKRVKKE